MSRYRAGTNLVLRLLAVTATVGFTFDAWSSPNNACEASILQADARDALVRSLHPLPEVFPTDSKVVLMASAISGRSRTDLLSSEVTSSERIDPNVKNGFKKFTFKSIGSFWTNGRVMFKDGTWGSGSLELAAFVDSLGFVRTVDQTLVFLEALEEKVILSRVMTFEELQYWQAGAVDQILSRNYYPGDDETFADTTFALNDYEFSGAKPVRFEVRTAKLFELYEEGLLRIDTYSWNPKILSEAMPSVAYSLIGLPIEIKVLGLEGRRKILSELQKNPQIPEEVFPGLVELRMAGPNRSSSVWVLRTLKMIARGNSVPADLIDGFELQGRGASGRAFIRVTNQFSNLDEAAQYRAYLIWKRILLDLKNYVSYRKDIVVVDSSGRQLFPKQE